MKQKSIVIVDDQFLYVKKTPPWASSIDAEIIIYSTSEEFYKDFSNLKKEPPVLFVFDLMLPYKVPKDNEMKHFKEALDQEPEEYNAWRGGLWCVELVRAEKEMKDIPILILTGSESFDDTKEFLSKNNASIYQKPFNKQFLANIENILYLQGVKFKNQDKLNNFLLENWQWIIGTIIAVVSVIIALL